jgi:mono/diheme cytochrome c family protein
LTQIIAPARGTRLDERGPWRMLEVAMRKFVSRGAIFLVSLIMIGGAGFGSGAEPMVGSPAEGLKFARDNCAECHHVGPKEPLVVFSPASPFSKIAADPKTTRFFLRSSHIDMPNFILTEEQTDDLVAYILSLK